MTRILLAAGFLPTGMIKLRGHRFTLIPPDNPIGAFFEAMYQTGLFWNFIGLVQVVAALLLLVPRWAHLGAAIFLPVIANIFVITVSLNFRGTPIVTGLMLTAVLYLCLWDFHRFRSLLTMEPLNFPVAQHRLDRWEFLGFTVFSSALLAFFGATRNLVEAGFAQFFVIAGFAAGLLTLVRFTWLAIQGRTRPLPTSAT